MARRRISNTTASILLTVAIFFDVLSLVPFLDIAIDFIAWLVFFLWFYHLGVGLTSPKKLAAPVISFFIEIIPGLSILPSISLAVAASIGIITLEDYRNKETAQSIENTNTASVSPVSEVYSEQAIKSRPEDYQLTENASRYGQRPQNIPSNPYQVSFNGVKPKSKQNNESDPFIPSYN